MAEAVVDIVGVAVDAPPAAPKVSVTKRILRHLDRLSPDLARPRRLALGPVSLEIHLTGFCNAACPFCFYAEGFHDGERLSKETLEGLLADIAALEIRSVVLSGGGEPTIHPSFPWFVGELRKLGVEVGIITNGMLDRPAIREALLQATWVKFSIHTADPKQYPALMGRPASVHRKVCGLIRDLTATPGRQTMISCGFVITPMNEELDDFVNFVHFGAGDLGTDYILFKPYIGPDKTMYPLKTNAEFAAMVPTVSKLAENLGRFTNFPAFVRDLRRERELRFGKCQVVVDGLIAVISSRGGVYPCLPLMQEDEERDLLGRLSERSFAEIWRDRHDWVSRHDDSDCPACRYERINELAGEALRGGEAQIESADPHHNFL